MTKRLTLVYLAVFILSASLGGWLLAADYDPASGLPPKGGVVTDETVLRGDGTVGLQVSEWVCKDDGSWHDKDGNARGQTSIDLQLDRAAANQVAQARSSFMGAGEDNRIDGDNVEFGLGYASGGVGGYDNKITQVNGAPFEGNLSGWVGGGNNLAEGGYADGFYTSEGCSIFNNGAIAGYNAIIASNGSVIGTAGAPNTSMRSNFIAGSRNSEILGTGDHNGIYSSFGASITGPRSYSGILGGKSGTVTASGTWLLQDGSVDVVSVSRPNTLVVAFRGGLMFPKRVSAGNAPTDHGILYFNTSDLRFRATDSLGNFSVVVQESDSPGGDLGGTYGGGPTVAAITTTTGPTSLVIGAVADGEFLRRSGSTLIGSPATVVSQATATGDTTTSSTTDVLMASMTITPGAGDYLVFCNTDTSNDTNGESVLISIYVNAVQVAHSERESTRGAQPNMFPHSTQAFVTSVLAAQAIECRWSVSNGASVGTAGERSLIVQKVN